MFWKLFLTAKILLLALSIWLIENWQLSTVLLLAVEFTRVFAVFTYAFDATRYSTTQFWGAFRVVYVASTVLAIFLYVSSLTVGFRYGIFPVVEAVYVIGLALEAALLSFLIWAEWTVITRLSRGETARSFANMAHNQ